TIFTRSFHFGGVYGWPCAMASAFSALSFSSLVKSSLSPASCCVAPSNDFSRFPSRRSSISSTVWSVGMSPSDTRPRAMTSIPNFVLSLNAETLDHIRNTYSLALSPGFGWGGDLVPAAEKPQKTARLGSCASSRAARRAWGSVSSNCFISTALNRPALVRTARADSGSANGERRALSSISRAVASLTALANPILTTATFCAASTLTMSVPTVAASAFISSSVIAGGRNFCDGVAISAPRGIYNRGRRADGPEGTGQSYHSSLNLLFEVVPGVLVLFLLQLLELLLGLRRAVLLAAGFAGCLVAIGHVLLLRGRLLVHRRTELVLLGKNGVEQ